MHGRVFLCPPTDALSLTHGPFRASKGTSVDTIENITPIRRGATKKGVNTINAVERQRRAVQMRVEGKSLQVIADALGYGHPSGAAKAINSALRKTLREPSDELRTLELERLDQMFNGLWPKMVRGDTRAIEVGIKLMERRAKFMGMDAAIKIDLNQIIDDASERYGLTEDEKSELQTEVANFLAAEKAAFL